MKISRSILLVLTVILAVSMFGGCATTFKASNGMLSYGEMRGTSKGTFETKASAIAIISPYLFPITKPNEKLDTLIEPELRSKGANAATNVEVKYGFDFLGLIITSVTGGLLNWNYCSVSGTAISR